MGSVIIFLAPRVLDRLELEPRRLPLLRALRHSRAAAPAAACVYVKNCLASPRRSLRTCKRTLHSVVDVSVSETRKQEKWCLETPDGRLPGWLYTQIAGESASSFAQDRCVGRA